jgi:pyrimidine-specific ribonucleoside hydrolase
VPYSTSRPPDPRTVRLWIDTDVGDNPDDAVALLCAAAHPDIELVGVSTVGGDTTWRAGLAQALVDAPVIAGGADYVPNAMATARPDAVLAIGPLTNIALAVAGGVSIPTLAVMGGASRPSRHRGRVQNVEHNFGADPLAARAVLGQTADALVVPLDVTAKMALDPDQERRLRAKAPALEEHIGRWRESTGDAPIVLHDPLAFLALCGEPVVRIQRRHLVVDRDGRLVQRADGPLHRIAVESDTRAAVERVMALLG